MRRELDYATEEEYFSKPVTTRGPKPTKARHPTPEEYPDPITRETCRIIGWDRLVDFDFDDPFRINEFQKAHEQARKTVEREVRAGRAPWAGERPIMISGVGASMRHTMKSLNGGDHTEAEHE
jgi:hypothetical protein